MPNKKTDEGKKENEEKEEPFTEDDYMDALRKASKPLPKEGKTDLKEDDENG